MKTAVIVFFFVAVFQASINFGAAKPTGTSSDLEAEEEECVQELHLNRQQVVSLNTGEITPDTDSDYNAFVGCVWQKNDFLSSEGVVDFPKLKELMKEVVVEELQGESQRLVNTVQEMMVSSVTHCENNAPPKGATHGQTAVRIQNCIFTKLNELVGE